MALELDKRRNLDALSYRGGALKGALSSLPNPTRITKLRKKSDFAKVATSGKKTFAPSLIIQTALSEGEGVRVGFIASKKVGCAVLRNRAKRKMRALAKEVLSTRAKTGWDYVLVAHPSVPAKSYGSLKKELEQAIKKIGQDHA
jgi:ribonuclease P protein component